MSAPGQDLGLPKFKQRSLERLEARQEDRNLYAIGPSDLRSVGRCVLCGSTNSTCVAEVYLSGALKFFATDVCNSCLYTFRSVSPSYRWFRKCWAQISSKKLEVFNPEMEELRRERYVQYRDLLGKYVRKPSVLDVGAGYGIGAKAFEDHGCRVEAVEPEDDKAYYAENALGIRVHATSIEEFIREGKRSYDLIIFAQCLEHVDDPAAVMAGVRDLLDPERGTLYVEVPDVWSLVTWSDALYLTHKSNFTERNLVSLARRNGFEILEKVDYQDAAAGHSNLGLVLRKAKIAMGSGQVSGPSGDDYDVEDIARLYRRKLPIPWIPPVGELLRYSVPYIDNFYYTLRLDRHRVVGPVAGFISFEPV